MIPQVKKRSVSFTVNPGCDLNTDKRLTKIHAEFLQWKLNMNKCLNLDVEGVIEYLDTMWLLGNW